MVLFTRPVAIKKIFVGFANLGKTTGEVTLNKLCEILRRKKARARKLYGASSLASEEKRNITDAGWSTN